MFTTGSIVFIACILVAVVAAICLKVRDIREENRQKEARLQREAVYRKRRLNDVRNMLGEAPIHVRYSVPYDVFEYPCGSIMYEDGRHKKLRLRHPDGDLFLSFDDRGYLPSLCPPLDDEEESCWTDIKLYLHRWKAAFATNV